MYPARGLEDWFVVQLRVLAKETVGLLPPHQRMIIALACLVGAAFSVGALLLGEAWERGIIRGGLDRNGREAALLIEHEFDLAQATVEAVRAFFAGSERVERGEFRVFTSLLRRGHPEVHAFAWIPAVGADKLSDLAAEAAADGIAGFRVREIGSGGKPEGAGRHCPVFYVEPEAYAGALGADLLSDATLVRCIEEARDSGEIRILQTREAVAGLGFEAGLLAFAPVYRQGASAETVALRRENVEGYLLADLDANRMLRTATQSWGELGIDVHVLAAADGADEVLLAFHSPGSRGTSGACHDLATLQSGLHYTAEVSICGREWTVVTTPARAFIESRQRGIPWLLFGAASLLSFVAVAYLVSVAVAAGWHRRAAADLAAAKDAMDRETAERSRAERALRESEERFRGVIEQSTDGMIAIDATGTVTLFNPASERIFGRSAQEMIGGPLDLLLTDDFRETHRGVVESYFRSGTPSQAIGKTVEVPALRADGTQITIALSLSRGEVSGTPFVLAVVRDITETKRVEAERSRLATVIAYAAESIVVTDLEGSIEYVNPAFERVSGYARDEVIGQNIMMLSSGPPGDPVHRDLWETLKRGDVWSGRFVNRRKDGTLYHDEATISPVYDAAGQAVNYVSVQRDITEQLALEARLWQAQKMEAIGTLAGGIAHDFNNILSAILGFTDLAMIDVPEKGRARESLIEVAKAGNRARELVSQILAFSRQTERKREPVRLQLIVKEALKLLRGSIPPTIEIQQEIDPGCGRVLADQTEMHQIVMNLCTNAYHAMRQHGGVMTVRLDQVEGGDGERDLGEGEYVRLRVSDTGHGMDEMTKARVFEPYFTTRERGEGTGLGLSTVHGIVSKAGGAIRVESEPDSGAEFEVLLPVAGDGAVPAERATVDREAVAGTERVLFVDDEEPIALFARAALGHLGYRVTSETNSLHALDAFRADPEAFDVMVTDQMMSGIRGTELIREVLAIRPG
ncbi:MAG: PAS domain S-box protein, partial [Candidatus Hydrogenedentes bacterium]|nr:PAS domain S-box protein [Candidatus Hydrogenedentota bacterium]